jgi:glycine/D-amino acid oxidase-like deaminating enzyme
MARIVVAGAGAIGASVAFHLASLGARDVVLADRMGIAAGATSKAMGGVRQQFSTAAEVRLAQASIRFFEELGTPLFEQVGYLFVATTEEGLAELEVRRELQAQLGVPVESVDPRFVEGLRTDDVLGAVNCATDGVADPPAVTRELVRRALKLGVEVRDGIAAETLDADVLVIACGPWSAELAATRGVELPVRPLCRQLLATTELPELPESLPMVLEAETGFHFRRRADRLVLAMVDPEPRWGFEERVDESLFDDRLARLRHRYPPASGATIERAWAGLYDMTPDAHPILGEVAEGVYAACGFSGHGFMQSPAVGRGLAEEILGLSPSLDLSPYRLARFDSDAGFPEELVL